MPLQDVPQTRPLARRVTAEDLDRAVSGSYAFTAAEAVMMGDTYDTPPTGQLQALELLTLCVVVMPNGYTVVGKSACADPAQFNAERGKQLALDDAKRQMWPLLGYALRDELHRRSDDSATVMPERG